MTKTLVRWSARVKKAPKFFFGVWATVGGPEAIVRLVQDEERALGEPPTNANEIEAEVTCVLANTAYVRAEVTADMRKR